MPVVCHATCWRAPSFTKPRRRSRRSGGEGGDSSQRPRRASGLSRRLWTGAHEAMSTRSSVCPRLGPRFGRARRPALLFAARKPFRCVTVALKASAALSWCDAPLAKLADAGNLKFPSGNGVPVRSRRGASQGNLHTPLGYLGMKGQYAGTPPFCPTTAQILAQRRVQPDAMSRYYARALTIIWVVPEYFKSRASVSFAIPAVNETRTGELSLPRLPVRERETGLEPATPTLARLCSTN